MGFLVRTVLILFVFNFAECELLPECDGVESQTFIADITDCESYIYCDGEESFVSKCSNNLRFDEENGVCDEPENVECLSVETSTTQLTLRTSTEKKTTEASSSTSKTTRTSSSSTKYIPTSSSTLATSPSTIYDHSSTTSLNVPIVCPIPSKPEEIVYLANPKSCSEYFLCFNNTPIPMKCPKNLEFNTLTSSCDWASMSNCKIVGTTTISPRELCTDNESGYFEYANNCQYYYRCLRGLLTIQECPAGFGWDAQNKMCSSTAGMECRRGI